STPPSASELMQDSVVLATGPEDGKSSETKEIRALLGSPSLTFDEAKSVDWQVVGGPRQQPRNHALPQAEKVVAPENVKRNSAVHMLTASLSKSMRSEVVESMLLIDGLLQEDRRRRISFDVDDATASTEQQEGVVTKRGLRAGRKPSMQLTTVPDVTEAPISHGRGQMGPLSPSSQRLLLVTNTTGVTCKEYMKKGEDQVGEKSHLGTFTPNRKLRAW
ncbi:hypothetical protein FOZ63_001244, partial [Perkinsus olseni]